MGFSYLMLNFADNDRGFVKVGQWSPCRSGAESCDWSEPPALTLGSHAVPSRVTEMIAEHVSRVTDRSRPC